MALKLTRRIIIGGLASLLPARVLAWTHGTIPGPVVWILATGSWNDAGVWDDTANWID